mmetsp:Transcript_31781/g.64690  ORF Transcript_31781/g.64690 Transcript_31781/m.64690 type:complete len:345 (+) Transcript_31781:123-1157(+)
MLANGSSRRSSKYFELDGLLILAKEFDGDDDGDDGSMFNFTTKTSGVCCTGAATAAAYSAGVYDEVLSDCLSSNSQDDRSASFNTEAIFRQQGPRKLNEGTHEAEKGICTSFRPGEPERSDESVIANAGRRTENGNGADFPLWGSRRLASSTKYIALSEEEYVGTCRTRKKGDKIHVPMWDKKILATATKYMALSERLSEHNSANQSFVKEHEEEVPRSKDFARFATLVRLLRRYNSTNKTGERASSDLTIALGPSGSFDTSAGSRVGSDHQWLPTPHLPAQSTRGSSILANSPSVRQVLLENGDTLECSGLPCPFDWTCPSSSVQDERGGTMKMIYFEKGGIS